METRSPSDNPVLKEIWSLYYQGKINNLKRKLEVYVSYLLLGYEDTYKDLMKPDVPAGIQAEAKRLVEKAQTDAQQSTLRKMQDYLADSNHLWPYGAGWGKKNGIEQYNFLTGSNVPNDIKQQAISLKEEGLSRVVPALKSWLKTHGTWPDAIYSDSEEGRLATAVDLLRWDPDLKLTPEAAEIERLYRKQYSTLEKIKKWCKSFFSK